MPRVRRHQFTTPQGYFTNLYDSDATLRLLEDGVRKTLQIDGELSDEKTWPGGVAYQMVYDFGDRDLVKTIRLRYHDRHPEIRIIEPIVLNPGVRVTRADARRVAISGEATSIGLELLSPEGEWVVDAGAEPRRHLFPGMRVVPVVLTLPADPSTRHREVRFRYRLAP